MTGPAAASPEHISIDMGRNDWRRRQAANVQLGNMPRAGAALLMMQLHHDVLVRLGTGRRLIRANVLVNVQVARQSRTGRAITRLQSLQSEQLPVGGGATTR